MKFFSQLKLDTLTHRPKPGDTMLVEDHQISMAEVSQENERLQLMVDVGQKHINALTKKLTEREAQLSSIATQFPHHAAGHMAEDGLGSPPSGDEKHGP